MIIIKILNFKGTLNRFDPLIKTGFKIIIVLKYVQNTKSIASSAMHLFL